MILNIMASIDIVFYLILGIAIFFGFLRGFKKSIYNFIVMAIFYLVFFLTLNMAVNMIWSMNLGFLGNVLGNVDSNLSSFQSFENDYQLIIQTFFNNSFDFTQSEMDLLAVGIIQFAIKILWAIAYFTVILILYKIITGIIRLIFVKPSKPKKRLFGSIVGVLNGAMAVFVSLIVLGGTVSFIESASVLMTSEGDESPSDLVFQPRSTILELNHSLIPDDNIIELAESDPLIDPGMQETMNELVDNYHSNIIVKLANVIKVDSAFNASEKVPLHINLFDSVLSFKYGDNEIALRHELSIFMNAYGVIQDSDFAESQKITDIKGEDIRSAFSYLESSILLPTALPIGIKYFSNTNEIDLSVSDNDLFDYDYTEEIGKLSNILAGVFDILNEQTTSIDEDGNEVDIDGEWVRDIFDDVSSSRVVLLATEAILVPMIEEGDGESEIMQIIGLPSQISWEDEYLALGNILAEMVDNGISIQDIESTDLDTVLETFASIDADVILGSDIISEGLINVLSGETSMEGLDVLTIPQNLTWRSTDSQTGELEYILKAIQALITEMDGLDFSNLDMDILTDMDQTSLSMILDSYIIRATITDQINSLELGTYQLIIPNTTMDSQGYYTKDELQAVIESIQLISDVDGFDIDSLFGMTSSDLDTLFSSEIIQATVSDVILDYATLTPSAGSTLVVPAAYRENITVNSQASEQITLVELKAIINALNTLGITDFDGGIDSSIISSLSSTDLDTVMESGSIHVTVDYMLQSNSQLIVPDDLKDNLHGFNDIIIKSEISNFLQASQVLGSANIINDGFDIDDLNSLSDGQLNTLLSSEIIQASISDIILDQATLTATASSTLIVPAFFRENITVNSLSVEQIELNELEAIIKAFRVLNITNFDGDIDPTVITSLDNPNLTTILESGSLHVTIDDMLQSNASLTSPSFVLVDLYDLTNLIEDSEIINFITAVDTLGQTDISSASFDFATIRSLNTTQQGIILDSAIVRATITPDVEDARTAYNTLNPLDPYSTPWLYESDTETLTKQSIVDFIAETV